MSQAAFEQFRIAVLSDPVLQAKLREFEDKKEFISNVVNIGGEMGYEFTAAEIESAMQASYSEWLLRWV
jgi:predicted ribosomally synthesized peptide with nif11-like leader